MNGLEENFNHLPTSDTFTNIFALSFELEQFISNMMLAIFPHLFIFIGVGTYLWSFDVRMGLSFLFVNFGVLLYIFLEKSKIENAASEATKRRNKAEEFAEDVFANIYRVASADRIQNEKRDIHSNLEAFQEMFLCRWRNIFVSWSVSETIMLIYCMACISYLFRLKTSNNWKEILAIVIILVYFMSEFHSNYYVIVNGFGYIASLKSMIRNINRSLVHSFRGPKPRRRARGAVVRSCRDCALSAKNLRYSYPDQKPIFKDFNLSFMRGQATCVVGKIGSGKSTLLKIIFGIHRASRGDIVVDVNNNVPLSKLNVTNETWRKNIHYCEQSPKLMNRSLSENILYGSTVSDRKADALMHRFDIDTIKAKGLGKSLSGGERQIVSIFQAITHEKPIVLLDEPTASLNDGSKTIVYRMMDYLIKRGSTVIIVSHDMSLIKRCHRVVTLDSGKVTSDMPAANFGE
jgi:ABC-type multidrug transport system fused ATPase/permease subunit